MVQPVNELTRSQLFDIVEEYLGRSNIPHIENGVSNALYKALYNTGTFTLPEGPKQPDFIAETVRNIHLCGCKITSEQIKRLAQHFPNLETLDLSYMVMDNPQAVIQEFITHATVARQLTFAYCPNQEMISKAISAMQNQVPERLKIMRDDARIYVKELGHRFVQTLTATVTDEDVKDLPRGMTGLQICDVLGIY